MTDPELLLLDEPAASLDLGAREELLQLLGGYAQSPSVARDRHGHPPRRGDPAPGSRHALLLADGEVVAAGPLAEVLTSENLTETFGLELGLTEDDGRFAARAA